MDFEVEVNSIFNHPMEFSMLSDGGQCWWVQVQGLEEEG